MSYIYLASPYTHKSAQVREARFQEVLKKLAEYTRAGEIVFSPIVHSHPLSWHGLDGKWEYWQTIDHTFIDQCSRLRVLQMKDWDKSVGVKAEIEYAQAKGKEIEYAAV